MDLSDFGIACEEIHQLAREKGWWDAYDLPLTVDDVDIISTKLMLTVSELSEALEELRNNHDPNDIYFKGEKPEGFPIEIADAVIRLMDLAEACGFEVETAIQLKHEYNKSREYRHGGKRV